MTRTLGNNLYQLTEGVFIAFDAIRTNKVRAGLTILGIAVGVFVVTVMSAAPRPARRRSSSPVGRPSSPPATAVASRVHGCASVR